ncbi:MAG: DUF4365 domain-containing protein [Thermomicrobiales bacterium]
MRQNGRSQPYFRLAFLGDTYPTIDYLVELVGAGGRFVPYFFVQVKTTAQGFTANGQLKVRVGRADLARLVTYPAPRYILGIDEPREVGYLVAALGPVSSGLSSLPVTHPLDLPALAVLYDEVRNFWGNHGADFATSAFA